MSISEARALASRLRDRRHLIDRLEAEWAADAARLADTNYHELEGSRRPADFLRHHCRMGEGAVRDRLAVGRRIDQMSAACEALSEGEIGFGHLVVMAPTGPSSNACTTRWSSTRLITRGRSST